MHQFASGIVDVVVLVIAVVLVLALGAALVIYLADRRQKQHAVLKNYPLLGRLRYLLEMIGPEMRQYWFDGDTEGKPFSRTAFTSIVMAGKYASSLIGFGSKRDFDSAGLYVVNAMFPKLTEEQHFDNSVKVKSRVYSIDEENLLSRREHWEERELDPWYLPEDEAVVIGPDCPQPFRVRGLVGMSAMSYGALGDHAITALSKGLAMAGETWMNTGEGGLAPYHLAGGGSVIAQIGPGLFGYRTRDGQFDPSEVEKKAARPEVKAFELKLAQGAKIRGGHLPGKKVTPEIAEIRKLEPWKPVDSPNRFHEFGDEESLLEFVARVRELGGKPVGFKIVLGGPYSMEKLCLAMHKTGINPDFITIDGGEGGSGATYRELADGVGLPIKSSLVIADDTLHKYGLREQVKLFASGKLYTPDRVAVALGLGADLVNMARPFMISVGCIGAQQCHNNTCPVGVATTDPELQQALAIEEKKYRVTNFVVTMRHGLYTIAAAAGLKSPRQLTREHIVYKDGQNRATLLADLFPIPQRVEPDEQVGMQPAG